MALQNASALRGVAFRVCLPTAQISPRNSVPFHTFTGSCEGRSQMSSLSLGVVDGARSGDVGVTHHCIRPKHEKIFRNDLLTRVRISLRLKRRRCFLVLPSAFILLNCKEIGTLVDRRAFLNTDLCKKISNRLHATCGGGQTKLRRGIHIGFYLSFYTPQYCFHVFLSSIRRPGEWTGG